MEKTRLKELREEKGLSQIQLAKILGVRNTAISNWEVGIRQLDIDTIVKLCDIFDVTTDYFLKRVEY